MEKTLKTNHRNLSKPKKILIQSQIIFIFQAIIIVIAAPIEAQYSVPFSEYIA